MLLQNEFTINYWSRLVKYDHVAKIRIIMSAHKRARQILQLLYFLYMNVGISVSLQIFKLPIKNATRVLIS